MRERNKQLLKDNKALQKQVEQLELALITEKASRDRRIAEQMSLLQTQLD